MNIRSRTSVFAACGLGAVLVVIALIVWSRHDSPQSDATRQPNGAEETQASESNHQETVSQGTRTRSDSTVPPTDRTQPDSSEADLDVGHPPAAPNRFLWRGAHDATETVEYAPYTYDDPRHRAVRDRFVAHIAPRVCPLLDDVPDADAVSFHGLDIRIHPDGRVFPMTGYNPLYTLTAWYRGRAADDETRTTGYPPVPDGVVEWVQNDVTGAMRHRDILVAVAPSDGTEREILHFDVLRSDCPPN